MMRLEHKSSLAERLQEQPALRAQIEQMLDLVEGTELTVWRADEAEEQVGEHLRQLGQATLQAWAESLQARQERYWDARPGLTRKEKKRSTGRRATGR